MATITNAQVKALARQLLWDQIDASTWHAGMTDEQRFAAIEADVEAWWHLRAGEAARLLVDTAIAACGSFKDRAADMTETRVQMRQVGSSTKHDS